MSLDAVRRYHDGTKHHFDRFARSLGYLDWASQPSPFRSFAGAPECPLRDAPAGRPAALARLLRYSLGLSAWKSFRTSRWALRVNPSSGNLHPTEAYLIAGSDAGLPMGPGVYHYAPDRHALEQRCAFDAAPAGLLLALTSIHWREAWKYGERAFRYCQHDVGHAIAAVRLAAALEGWDASIVPAASHADVAVLTGVDRDEDFSEAEREDAACVLAIDPVPDPDRFVEAARAGRWAGRASRLGGDHVQWTFIDEVAAATRDPGRAIALDAPASGTVPDRRTGLPLDEGPHPGRPLPDRAVLLQRRSALGFDGRTAIAAAAFEELLRRAMPEAGPPFDAIWWAPRIHLVMFVHRVDGVPPGVYCLARRDDAVVRLRQAFRAEFAWQRVSDELPLFLLAAGDCRQIAERLSCDQEIAADGFFSLGMIAEFDAALDEFGAAFYRNLFWESGIVGQALYLAAEAAGARGTGIGCFYDDPVHDLLGIRGHGFQSLYHFTIGAPVEDARLTTEPGYDWERR